MTDEPIEVRRARERREYAARIMTPEEIDKIIRRHERQLAKRKKQQEDARR